MLAYPKSIMWQTECDMFNHMRGNAEETMVKIYCDKKEKSYNLWLIKYSHVECLLVQWTAHTYNFPGPAGFKKDKQL